MCYSKPQLNRGRSSPDPHPNDINQSRLINRYYRVHNGELIMGGVPVSRLIETYGSPQFVYDDVIIRRKVHEVLAALIPRFRLYYSVKANPNQSVLSRMLDEGCGLEVASAGELLLALKAGCPPGRIIFAGPGKTEDELAAAVDACIREIHVESIEEGQTIDRLARRIGHTATIGLRVNPVDASGGAMRMGGKASPFGIDEEDLDHAIDALQSCQNVKITGVHLFMGTQILEAETLIGQYRRAVSIAKKVARRIGPLETIDFGGGWGTPYFDHEQPLDLEVVRHGILSVDEALAADPLLANAEAIIEPGRFLVNEAGVYLCTVTRVKRSRGKTFAIMDGGMHHHLAASGNLGQVIKRNFPVAIVNKLGVEPTETVDIVGPLCTPLDTIGRELVLPPVAPGDLVGVFLSGAYARTSSPLGFLSHNAPPEIMVGGGRSKLIRRRGEPSDYLRDQTNLEPAEQDVDVAYANGKETTTI